jgi:hypothetical protein
MTQWDPASGSDPAAAFAAAYRREFGFVLDRPVVVDDARARATGRCAALPDAKVRGLGARAVLGGGLEGGRAGCDEHRGRSRRAWLSREWRRGRGAASTFAATPLPSPAAN